MDSYIQKNLVLNLDGQVFFYNFYAPANQAWSSYGKSNREGPPLSSTKVWHLKGYLYTTDHRYRLDHSNSGIVSEEALPLPEKLKQKDSNKFCYFLYQNNFHVAFISDKDVFVSRLQDLQWMSATKYTLPNEPIQVMASENYVCTTSHRELGRINVYDLNTGKIRTLVAKTKDYFMQAIVNRRAFLGYQGIGFSLVTGRSFKLNNMERVATYDQKRMYLITHKNEDPEAFLIEAKIRETILQLPKDNVWYTLFVVFANWMFIFYSGDHIKVPEPEEYILQPNYIGHRLDLRTNKMTSFPVPFSASVGDLVDYFVIV